MAFENKIRSTSGTWAEILTREDAEEASRLSETDIGRHWIDGGHPGMPDYDMIAGVRWFVLLDWPERPLKAHVALAAVSQDMVLFEREGQCAVTGFAGANAYPEFAEDIERLAEREKLVLFPNHNGRVPRPEPVTIGIPLEAWEHGLDLSRPEGALLHARTAVFSEVVGLWNDLPRAAEILAAAEGDERRTLESKIDQLAVLNEASRAAEPGALPPRPFRSLRREVREIADGIKARMAEAEAPSPAF